MRRPILLSLATFVTSMLAGCGSESLRPEPIIDDDKLYWDLALNHHAVTMSTASTYDTLRLVATPRNYQGHALSGLPLPQYVSRDQEKVDVTDEGLLVAVAPSVQPIWVVATLTTDNLKHEDSVLVKVVSDNHPPVLRDFSIHPILPDSAKWGASAVNSDIETSYGLMVTTALPRRMNDINGAPLNPLDFPVYFGSLDTTIAKVHPISGVLLGLRPGAVAVHASATMFGVTKADTLPYRIGWPVSVLVTVGVGGARAGAAGNFVQRDFTIGVGGVVLWQLYTFDVGDDFTLFPFPEIDVTFADADLGKIVAPDLAAPFLAANPNFESGGPGPSDIPVYCFVYGDCGNGSFTLGGGLWTFGSSVHIAGARAFTEQGTYEYHSVRHGTRGRIVVVKEQ